MREYAGGRGYSKYLYQYAKRKWIINLSDTHRPLDQHFIIYKLRLSWPTWRSILNGSDMKISTFFKICIGLNIPVDTAIVYEAEFQKHKGEL